VPTFRTFNPELTELVLVLLVLATELELVVGVLEMLVLGGVMLVDTKTATPAATRTNTIITITRATRLIAILRLVLNCSLRICFKLFKRLECENARDANNSSSAPWKRPFLLLVMSEASD